MSEDKLGFDFGANKEITGDDYDASLAVTCENGTFVGRHVGGCVAWLGIPFAKPPVGELRWEKPVPCDPSTKVFEAYNYGLKPVQFVPTEGMGEDCLNLNIAHAEDAPQGKKPVMVWIHGGGFMNESASDNLYLPYKFVANNPDVLFVSIEYRLGIFGFLTFDGFPGGEDYDYTGVLGLFDQIAALRWIKNNIAAFGGDPDNITIYGESAGGISISLLPVFPEAKGLFNRCVPMSGSAAYTFTKDDRRFVTENLVDKTGCKNIEELKSLSVEELTKDYWEISGGPNCYSPIRDDVYLPINIEELMEKWAESVKDIDVLTGFVRNEARYALSSALGINEEQAESFFRNTHEATKKRVSAQDMEVAEAYMREFPEGEEWKTMERMYSMVGFGFPSLVHANALADKGNIWAYESALPAEMDSAAAFHGSELAYLFHHDDAMGAVGRNDDLTYQRINEVQEILVSFASTGVPSLNGQAFKKYDSKDRAIILIDRDDIRTVDHYRDKDVELLMPLLQNTYWFTYESFSLDWGKVDEELRPEF